MATKSRLNAATDAVLVLWLLAARTAFAVAGSGGGGAGGGGSGAGSGLHGNVGSDGLGRIMYYGDGTPGLKFALVSGGMLLGLALYVQIKVSRARSRTAALLAKNPDPNWNEGELRAFLTGFLPQVQRAWSQRNASELQRLLNPELFDQWRLRLEAAESRGQKNEVSEVSILEIGFAAAKDFRADAKDEYVACIRFEARDRNLEAGRLVSDERREFTEYWRMGRHAKGWRLKEVMREGVLAKLSLALEEIVDESAP